MKLDSRHKNGVSLQGNIANIQLDQIFQFFDYVSISGEIRVVAEHNNASFFFQKGMLIFGALSVNQKRIGDLLLESGLVTEAQLEKCLKIHAEYGKKGRLGEILVQEGVLTLESLAEILQNQAKEAFFESLFWKEGMFYFYSNMCPSREEILINERIDHLLFEGIVRLDDSSAADTLETVDS